jgi:hypothetical protein
MTKLDKLLNDLFTNGDRAKADRLMLVRDKPNACGCKPYQNLGGRNRISVRDMILRHFPELPER